MGVVHRSAPKTCQIEPFSQRRSRHGLTVFRPQPSQAFLCVTRRHELRLAARMKPDQQPFEIRVKVDQLQTFAAFDRLRVAPGGTVLGQSIGIDKN